MKEVGTRSLGFAPTPEIRELAHRLLSKAEIYINAQIWDRLVAKSCQASHAARPFTAIGQEIRNNKYDSITLR